MNSVVPSSNTPSAASLASAPSVVVVLSQNEIEKASRFGIYALAA
jgi:hypothetical protein